MTLKLYFRLFVSIPLLLISCSDKDMDGDGLTNRDEMEIWGSDPNNSDSDGDGLMDGVEINTHYTSPIISDTDGDGLNDFQEVNEYSFAYHPLIANAPILEIDLTGSTMIRANVERGGNAISEKETTINLEYGQSSSSQTQDTNTHEVSAEISASVSVEAEASLVPSAKVTAEVSATAGYAYTNTSSVSKSSSSDSRSAYGKMAKNIEGKNWKIIDGTIAAQINIKNSGELSYTLEEITVTAIQRDLNNPNNYRSVAQLNTVGFKEITLGPNETRKNIRVESTISGDLALELMAEPERLILEVNHFELSKYDAETQTQTSFSYVQQETNAKTAYIHIDYGNGNTLRKRIATNIRKTKGANKGEYLSDIMTKILDLDYKTEMIAQKDSDSIQVITGIWDDRSNQYIERNDSLSGFWTLVGSKDIRISEDTRMEDVMVPGGSALYLLYVTDEDNDGLFASEEYMYGTYDSPELALQNGITDSRDYDGDGILDGDEVKKGWDIQMKNGITFPPYDTFGTKVYSSPKEEDADKDGLPDAKEKEMGTDPNNNDTDGDGDWDKNDPDPLNPKKYKVGTA